MQHHKHWLGGSGGVMLEIFLELFYGMGDLDISQMRYVIPGTWSEKLVEVVKYIDEYSI